MTHTDLALKHGDTASISVAPDPVVPPVDPPPVEPPPNALEVTPAKWSQAYLDARKDGEVVLLRGGEFNTPFLHVRKKITLQNFPGEVPILTRTGRPDILYHHVDGVVRGLKFVSQSPGFANDSQGAALAEVRADTVAIGLVWYDGCEFAGTSKMGTTEQLLYLSDLGKPIAEVRVTGTLFDGNGTQGYAIHPYDGPSPKLVSVSRSTFRDLPRNAGVLNAANACLAKVDACTFEATVVTHCRGMYGPVDVSNSILHGNAIGNVNNLGGNTGWTTPR